MRKNLFTFFFGGGGVRGRGEGRRAEGNGEVLKVEVSLSFRKFAGNSTEIHQKFIVSIWLLKEDTYFE